MRAAHAFGLLAALVTPAAALTGSGYPRNLPQTLRGTVQVPIQGATNGLAGPGTQGDRPAADTLTALYPRLAACWETPPGLARVEGAQITARLSLRRDGSVIGVPRITFASEPPDSRTRAVLVQAALDAIRRCTPVRVTPALGGAIAGRPIALRFVYHGPKGQGV